MSRSPMRSHQQHSHPWSSSANKRRHQVEASLKEQRSKETIDGGNKEHVKELLKDLEEQCNKMKNVLRSELESHKAQQEDAVSVALSRLPKRIQKMTVKEFNQMHGCDLIALIKSKDGVKVRPTKKREHDAVAETPAPTRRNPNAPNSILRTARRGEGL